MPPLIPLAVNVTLDPAHIVLLLPDVMERLGLNPLPIDMMMVLLLTALFVTHPCIVDKTHHTASPDVKLVSVYVVVFVPTSMPFFFH